VPNAAADTGKVGAKPAGLDIGLVGDWMRDLGLPGTFEATRLGDGKSNLTYLLDAGEGRRWVLRRPPLGPLLPSAHDMAREYRILGSLADTRVPVPRALALREPDERLDVPLLLMEHVQGCVIDSEHALDRVTPGARLATGLSLARSLGLIHEVDLEAVGLNDLASHKPYAERQLRRWSRQYQASKSRDLPLVGQLAERLAHAAPQEHEVRLVHGDFHLLNAIVDPADGAVLAVLDWELSTLGDPLADLGGLLAYWPEATDPVPPTPHPYPAADGFPSRAELVDAYRQASGRATDAVGYWETLGCWKVAIICEGVLRRSLEDPANGDPVVAARTTELMLQRAADAADRAGI
jgi:aminoglycoside phosphotransferase (APT) family kinase protein